MGIPGASRFLGAATLANQQGIPAQTTSVLDNSSGGSTGLLDAGRRSAAGVGLSASARQLNQSLLSRTADVNALFSLAVGPNATAEGAAQAILALRAGINESQLAPSLRTPPPEAAADDGGLSAPTTGSTIDTEA